MDYVVEDTAAAIRSGRLALGQRLVEADMVRDLGVSRGTLREALNRLAAAGLVEIIPNRGAVVRRLTRKEVADRFEIRARVEGLAAFLAAQRLDEADHRARLLAVARPLEDGALPEAAFARRGSYLIHETIADVSGNAELGPMVRQLRLPAVMVEIRRSLDEDRAFWRRVMQEHRQIVDAILARDATAAEAAMRLHIEANRDLLLSLPARLFAG